MNGVHPIRRADVQAAVERWTELLLPGGTGTITVEFDMKDGQFRGIRLGGLLSRLPLDNGENGHKLTG